ncbi:MAG: hypothetical protein ACXWQE_12965 [Bdellovibrionales bacterium]
MSQENDDQLNMKMSFLFGALILFLSANTFAAERYHYYNGIRQMGMGGASVATVNDETALITNPAALGKLRDYFITVFDPELDIGVQTQQIAGTSELSMTDPQKALDKANLHPDKHLHLRGQVFPSIVVPNFGVGFFGKYVVDSQLDSATNLFTYDYTNDYALVMGVNFRFFNGIMKIGSNARITNRTEVRNSTIDPTSTNLTLSGLASSGVGVGSDTGIIMTAPVAYLPTIAAVYRDAGRTSYGLRDGIFMKTATKPDSTPGTLDGAISISPILGKRVRSTWTVELQDSLNVAKEKDIMRRAHGGVEFNFADAVFVRAGMNQRYWTAGLELSMMNYQFQAASYGEDIGPDQTPKEDRRYVVKFAFRF